MAFDFISDLFGGGGDRKAKSRQPTAPPGRLSRPQRRAPGPSFSPGLLNPNILERQRQQALFQQADQDQMLGPVQPRGKDRLDLELRANPHKPGTAAYDRWVLGLREDPSDPEYNIALRGRQGPAARREEMRANPDVFKPDVDFRPGEPVTPEDFAAREQVREAEAKGPKRGTPVIVGPDGEPLPDQAATGFAGEEPTLSGQAAGEVAPITLSRSEALRSGNYVWLNESLSEPQGRFGGRTSLTDQFMRAEDAVLLPYRWSPEQVAYAQEAMGLDVTGFADQALINGWASIVASSAGYAQAGRKVDPFTLLDMTFDATQAARRGSGGGGGGGATLSLSDTTAFLNAIMLEEAGREATNTEAEQFHAAFSGAGEVDPTQFATDWVRSVVGGEAAAFQAGTDYYQAMLSILGSNTQAEEGPQ